MYGFMQIMHSGIPDDVLLNASPAYQIVRTDFTENRKGISKANLWKVLYQFYIAQPTMVQILHSRNPVLLLMKLMVPQNLMMMPQLTAMSLIRSLIRCLPAFVIVLQCVL